MKRQFNLDAPNKVWVSDITYVRAHEGFLYVASVIDLFSRRVVGWSMDKTIDRHLVINALLMADWQRKPESEVLVHSDQGSQYASSDYLAFMKAHNLTPFMSRRGIVMITPLQRVFSPPFRSGSQNERSIPHEKRRKVRYLILLRYSTIQ